MQAPPPVLADSAAGASSPTANELTPEEKAGGWELLFDGSTNKGWTGGVGMPFPDRGWEIVDGALHLQDNQPGRSLYSEQQFTDFDFTFEWKIAKAANSGVKYLATPGRIHPWFLDQARPWVSGLWIGVVFFGIYVALLARRIGFLKQPWPFRIGTAVAIFMGLWLAALGWGLNRAYAQFRAQPPGYEYQIIDDKDSPDVHGDLQKTGALYDLLPAPESRPLSPGEWNQSRVLVKGNHVEHWLNGAKILEFELGSPQVKGAVAKSKFKVVEGYGEKSSGLIELQNHGDEAWFRNLKIRKL
jgi:hypothetical protein